jgi:glutaredoxin
MNKHLIVFTMEGCPYCYEFKDKLRNENIDFIDMDINENEEEYEMFMKIVDNDLVPAFMVVDEDGGPSTFMAPDRDYEDLDTAIHKVKSVLFDI